MSTTTDKYKSCISEMKKLKILALHGYRQNAQVFRQKTGSFRKLVNKYAEFVYITAPHVVIPVNSIEGMIDVDLENSPSEQYGWWFNRDDKTFRGIRKGGPALGFEESVKLIQETWEREGPFDGILGFSQGACFTGLLCDLQQRGIFKYKFKFAIMVSGFKSGSLPHLKFYDELIYLPTLHIYGENDQVIPKDMSENLADCFESSSLTVVLHEGGHYFPASSVQKHQYQQFFRQCQSQWQSEEHSENETSNV